MKVAAAAREAALWLIAAFLAWVFTKQGFAKFSDTSGWAAAFRTWHYPDWFRILIGVIEMASAVLVLIPRAAFVGGLLIAAVMLGGMGTHVYWGRPGQVTSEILPLLLGTLVALGRRKLFFSSWTRTKERG